jgi:hypothetical protein
MPVHAGSRESSEFNEFLITHDFVNGEDRPGAAEYLKVGGSTPPLATIVVAAQQFSGCTHVPGVLEDGQFR